MINLVVNSKCNQQCEYCFAYSTLHNNNTIMSLQVCNDILDFNSKSNNILFKEEIGIIGGEPTLHPQFDKILYFIDKYSKKHDFMKSILFTNGTNLCRYEDNIRQMSICGLINVNHPDMVGIQNYNNTCEAIEKFKDTFNIGVNIYPYLTDYSFIFDIIDKYQIKLLRTSISCPDGKFKHMQDKRHEYLSQCIEIFINFCKEAMEHNLFLYMDCSTIPICYFSERQRNIIKHVCTRYPCITMNGRICSPNIEIHPDYSVTSCFTKKEDIYMNDFDSPDSLYDYINNNWIDNLYRGMAYDECANCNLFDNKLCQGGCFRFSQSMSCN